jgi:hypothetical protein
VKTFVALSLLLCACGSSSSGGGSAGSGGAASGACPTLAGTWTITAHCVSSFVGQTVTVSQSACALTFAAPFNGYTGTVASDGKLNVMGPTAGGTQECTGSATTTTIDLSCPGPCAVTLAHE